jgi:hypothetical protein
MKDGLIDCRTDRQIDRQRSAARGGGSRRPHHPMGHGHRRRRISPLTVALVLIIPDARPAPASTTAAQQATMSISGGFRMTYDFTDEKRSHAEDVLPIIRAFKVLLILRTARSPRPHCSDDVKAAISAC